jgi:acetyl-CoA C-acetyltransferase
MASDPVVIVSAARTPPGRFMGDLSPFSGHPRVPCIVVS